MKSHLSGKMEEQTGWQLLMFFFFFQAEDGIRDVAVTGVQTCALPILRNPSAAFLAERPAGAPGSAVLATLEGSRPVLVEIQALVSRSGLALPRRTAIGLDGGRVALLLAVLEKRLGMPLHDQDVFLNVAGGLHVAEPAADLAVVAAGASGARGP